MTALRFFRRARKPIDTATVYHYLYKEGLGYTVTKAIRIEDVVHPGLRWRLAKIAKLYADVKEIVEREMRREGEWDGW